MLDKAAMESETTAFTGDGGFPLHGINGEMVFPAAGADPPGAVVLREGAARRHVGGVAFGLTVLQIAFALLGHGLPILGVLHGANALLIFGVAVMAAMAARGSAPVAERTAAAAG